MVQDVITSIEKKESLYSLKIGDFSIWDGIRYDVISYINANESKDTSLNGPKTNRQSLLIKVKCFVAELWSYIKLKYFLKKSIDYLFLISSRYKDNVHNFDRQVEPLLDRITKERFVIIDYHSGSKYDRRHYIDSAPLYFSINKNKYIIDNNIPNYIASVINNGFGKQVIAAQIISFYIKRFLAYCDYYSKLLSDIKPRKIIVSYGRFKAICAAASKKRVPVHLLQHALIFENDYALANTCPLKKQGYFPDSLYSYGSYWGRYMSNLTEVHILGNKYLSKKLAPARGNSMLVISTTQQGVFLSPIIKRFSDKHPEIQCLYRLHPTEYKIKEQYVSFFEKTPNVQIVTNDMSFDESLSKCSIVIGIFSTALFEALHNDRIVAVLYIDKYETYLSNLKGLENVYFFNNEDELFEISKKQVLVGTTTYFEPLNDDSVQQILS